MKEFIEYFKEKLDTDKCKEYLKIVQKYKKYVILEEDDGNVEHHILPVSLGGSDTKENLVRIPHKEHYICHLLLTCFTEGEDNRSMSSAINLMAKKVNYDAGKYEELMKKRFDNITKYIWVHEVYGTEYCTVSQLYRKYKSRQPKLSVPTLFLVLVGVRNKHRGWYHNTIKKNTRKCVDLDTKMLWFHMEHGVECATFNEFDKNHPELSRSDVSHIVTRNSVRVHGWSITEEGAVNGYYKFKHPKLGDFVMNYVDFKKDFGLSDYIVKKIRNGGTKHGWTAEKITSVNKKNFVYCP